MKKKILFICTHNSARSQMAEGYMNAKYGDRYEVFSGGTEPCRVHPAAIAVMKEIGIDISGHRSKLIDEHYGKGIETVVTVCDSAQKACPFFPGRRKRSTRVSRTRQRLPAPMTRYGPGSGRCVTRSPGGIDATFGTAHA